MRFEWDRANQLPLSDTNYITPIPSSEGVQQKSRKKVPANLTYLKGRNNGASWRSPRGKQDGQMR